MIQIAELQDQSGYCTMWAAANYIYAGYTKLEGNMSRNRRVPYLEFLKPKLMEQIIDEAFEVLERRGVLVENREGTNLLEDAGMKVLKRDDRGVVISITRELIEKSLKTVPSSVKLYDRDGSDKSVMTLEMDSDKVYFDPGSSAPCVLDYQSKQIREPRTKDLVDFVRVADALPNIDAQSTAVVPTDVPAAIADRYRLFLVLRNSTKAVVTGTFSLDGFEVMKEMLVTIRGDEKALKEKPLAIFSACPSPPLKWSNLTCHDLIRCARAYIPVELISMPLTGASAPITLTGTLVQHTAETLSGVVISQLAQPGAPLLWGGSPAAFDMRTGTTPMGAIETMMIDGAYMQVGRYFGFPTQAYMGLSDSKLVDAQAGLESGMGTMLAALCGANLVAGSGMLVFESCQSVEKLVIDNEICGMVKRLIAGIAPRTKTLAEDLLQGDIYAGTHFLASPTTARWCRDEFFYPGVVIDRNNRETWAKKGSASAGQRAHQEVTRILSSYKPAPLNPEIDKELVRLMTREARKYGMERLPDES